MPKFHYIYTYNLKKVPASKKVRFVYLLKGRRGEKGIIHELKGKFLAPGCFIVPEKSDKETTHIFQLWGIKFKKQKIQLID
ncbi:hypothetical protein ACFLYT_01130 [Nanoarchaeota archaeon]